MKLYKPSKKGDKVQYWEIQVEGNRYRTIEGYLDMVLTESAWTTCFPKNVGRSNSTTAEEQAVLEAESKVQKKIDKGYVQDIEKISRPFVPTLAKEWSKYKKEVQYPAAVSFKYDGIRCYFEKGSMFYRSGKPVLSCGHLLEGLDTEYILDGELYNHELKADFNKIVSLVRRDSPSEETRNVVKFYAFDLVSDKPYTERYKILEEIVEKNPDFVIAPTFTVNNEDEVDELLEMALQNGYEGVMIRWGNEGYTLERTKYLLKYKSFRDDEFEVVDILEGRGKRAGTCAKWVLKTEGGDIFEAGPTGTDAENLEIYKNKENYIGKMATIKFQDLTPAGVPRFGTFKAIRE